MVSSKPKPPSSSSPPSFPSKTTTPTSPIKPKKKEEKKKTEKKLTPPPLPLLQSLRIVPAENHTSTFSHIRPSAHGAPSAPGLHDTLRAGVGPDPFTQTTTSSTVPTSAHPLEARLRQWAATREALRMATLRRAFGVAEPARRGMELRITRDGEWRPLALGGGARASLHEDILQGRDASVEWEDVFTGEEQRAAVGVHDEMERKLKM